MRGRPMIEFILERYNYWIVIVLMMTGLYIVFARGNLIKTIIGLNLFQTSVFIFYITVGKVAGGTAPILVTTYGDKGHGEKAHSDKTHSDKSHGGDHPADGAAQSGGEGDAAAMSSPSHAAGTDAGRATGEAALTVGPGQSVLQANIPGERQGEGPALSEMGHMEGLAEVAVAPNRGPAQSLAAPAPSGAESAAPQVEIVPPSAADPAGAAAEHGAAHAGEYGAGVGDVVLYSNPLPHVLILTAIVVGVATTAVGLAIAVRIREAYGTIEEDALEQFDNEAEFGPGVALTQ